MQECKACIHPKRTEIDAMLVAGTPSMRDIERQMNLSRSALSRHKAHLAPALATAKKAGDVAAADSLLERIESLISDCKGIVEKAQAAKDYSAAVRALGEVRQSLELLGQVSGELKRGAGVNVGVAVILSEQDRHDLERGRAKSFYEKLTPEEFDAKEAELLAILAKEKQQKALPPAQAEHIDG